MTVIQISCTGRIPQHLTYKTDISDIKDAAQAFGQTDDVVELYNNDGVLIGIAKWPQGSKAYMYCVNPAEIPPYRVYRY